MSVELRPEELERLLTLDRKFAREGLTFDDVLLVPAESAVLPNDVSTATRLTRTIELEIPIVSAAMDTVTEARLAIALAREGGIGILHRNLSIEQQVAEVDRVKRSEAGMIAEPVTLRPEALVSDALELMSRYHISGVPITDADGRLVGILTNRDLRFEDDIDAARVRADDEPQPRHGAGGHDARRGRGDPAPAQGREAARRRRRGPAARADHGQGHLEACSVPPRDEGRRRTAARRRGGRRRAGRGGAGRGARGGRGRRPRRRHRARSLAGGDRDGAASARPARRAARRRQHRHRRGGRGADRGGRGRGQGRHRPGGHLHDPRRRRRRRPPGDRDLRLRPGCARARRSGDRRRRPDLLRRHRQGDRRRSRLRDDGLDPRRRRRGARRGRRRTRASASRSTAAWARWAR